MTELTTVRHQGVCEVGHRVDVENPLYHHLQVLRPAGASVGNDERVYIHMRLVVVLTLLSIHVMVTATTAAITLAAATWK